MNKRIVEMPIQLLPHWPPQNTPNVQILLYFKFSQTNGKYLEKIQFMRKCKWLFFCLRLCSHNFSNYSKRFYGLFASKNFDRHFGRSRRLNHILNGISPISRHCRQCNISQIQTPVLVRNTFQFQVHFRPPLICYELISFNFNIKRRIQYSDKTYAIDLRSSVILIGCMPLWRNRTARCMHGPYTLWWILFKYLARLLLHIA